MTPLEFVTHIPYPDSGLGPFTEQDALEALKMFYCRFFAEDRVDGSQFDNEVLDAIERIGRLRLNECPDRHVAGPCRFESGYCMYCGKGDG